MNPQEVGRLGQAVLDQVGTVVVGKREPLELVLAGVLAGGHVLLEDLPGLGKTLTARSFAQALGIEFRRLQFTPDLLPADVTGSFLYDQRSHDFTFRAGPVFTNLLLADEINR
ncbi:MAG: AAA family ATPase, partial [Micromonosporaceae bacterium]|nr:AAA family ATPase [Micromonosporaceae bacterium]